MPSHQANNLAKYGYQSHGARLRNTPSSIEFRCRSWQEAARACHEPSWQRKNSREWYDLATLPSPPESSCGYLKRSTRYLHLVKNMTSTTREGFMREGRSESLIDSERANSLSQVVECQARSLLSIRSTNLLSGCMVCVWLYP